MDCPELEAAIFYLALVGWLVAIISCSLPMWRVIKVSEETSIWQGLWNLCETEGLKSLRCMTYNSRPVLPQDLQVSGVLVVICIIITFLGLLLYVTGHNCITCESNINNERKIKMAASVLILGAGLLLLVPVSWVTDSIIFGMANPEIVSPWKPEMGASLYLAWLSSLLLLLGGALLGVVHLWSQAPSNNDQPRAFEDSSNEQPRAFEDFSNDQPSAIEGSSNEQPRASEDSSNDQPSAFEGSSNDQPSAFEGSSNDQPRAFEGSSNDQPSAIEDSSNEQPRAFEDFNNDQPSAFGGSSNEQPRAFEGYRKGPSSAVHQEWGLSSLLLIRMKRQRDL